MADLPDWFAAFQGLSVEATSFTYGLDAAKKAVPAVSEIYWATDTKKLYVCATTGTWTGLDASVIVQGILTLYANVVGGGYRITGLGDPSAAQDAATQAYVLAQKALCLLLTGGTMSGAIAMGTSKITGLGAPSADTDADTKGARNTAISAALAFTTQADVTASRAINGTVYQNTGATPKFVVVSISNAANSLLTAYCAAGASPGTVVSQQKANATTTQLLLVFIVPPSYYYKVTYGLTGTLDAWIEWS